MMTSPPVPFVVPAQHTPKRLLTQKAQKYMETGFSLYILALSSVLNGVKCLNDSHVATVIYILDALFL